MQVPKLFSPLVIVIILVLHKESNGAFVPLGLNPKDSPTTAIVLLKGEKFIKEFQKYANTLKLGDPCSWENEQFRRNYSQNSGKYLTGSKQRSEITLKFVEETIAQKRTFCDALQLLTCSKESGACVCGDSMRMAMFPGIDVTSDFVIETLDGVSSSTKEHDGEQRCRWKDGSYCASEDLAKYLGQKPDSKCQKGTTCMSMKDHKPCTFNSVVNYIAKNTDGGRSIRSGAMVVKMKEDMFNGKICRCQATSEDANQIGSDEDEKKRNKRSLDLFNESDVDMIMGLVAPPFTQWISSMG